MTLLQNTLLTDQGFTKKPLEKVDNQMSLPSLPRQKTEKNTQKTAKEETFDTLLHTLKEGKKTHVPGEKQVKVPKSFPLPTVPIKEKEEKIKKTLHPLEDSPSALETNQEKTSLPKQECAHPPELLSTPLMSFQLAAAQPSPPPPLKTSLDSPQKRSSSFSVSFSDKHPSETLEPSENSCSPEAHSFSPLSPTSFLPQEKEHTSSFEDTFSQDNGKKIASAAEIREAKVSIVSLQSHLPPALSKSFETYTAVPLSEVSNILHTSLETLKSASPPVLKRLCLLLHPADLGEINITLALQNNETLSVHITCMHQKTADLLEKTSSQMKESLGAQSILIEHHALPAVASTPPLPASQNGGGTQFSSGNFLFGSNGFSSAERNSNPQEEPQKTDHDLKLQKTQNQTETKRARSGLFI